MNNFVYSESLREVYAFEDLNFDFQELDYSFWLEKCILDKVIILPFNKKESFLIHDLDLQGKAVSFKKGCYLGQEIVARVEYRAKNKKKLAVICKNDYQNQVIVFSSLNYHLILS